MNGRTEKVKTEQLYGQYYCFFKYSPDAERIKMRIRMNERLRNWCYRSEIAIISQKKNQTTRLVNVNVKDKS